VEASDLLPILPEIHVHQRIPRAVLAIAVAPDQLADRRHAYRSYFGGRSKFATHSLLRPDARCQHPKMLIGKQWDDAVNIIGRVHVGAPGVLPAGLLRPD